MMVFMNLMKKVMVKGLGYASDYTPIDDEGSIKSDSEEEGSVNLVRSIRIRYNLTIEVPIFCVRMIFDNVDQFRFAARKLACKKVLSLRFKINNSDKVKVVCRPRCPFTLHVSFNPEGEFVIKTYKSGWKCFWTSKVKIRRLAKEQLKVYVSLAMCKRVK